MSPVVSRPMTGSSSSHLVHIQGLRAVAVVVVALEHAVHWPRGGFVGVDVFFVISGFVITRALIREREATGSISLRRFVVRRLRRLLPAAIVVTMITSIVWMTLFYLPRSLPALWAGAAGLTSTENWHLARLGSDYFGATSAASPFQHFWSLSVEEQFYAVWPLVFVITVGAAAAGRARRRLKAVVVVTVIASLAIGVGESVLRPAWAYFSLESRAWELGIGVLLALFEPTLSSAVRRPRVSSLAAATGWCAFALSLFASDGTVLWPVPGALLPTAAAALLIIAGLDFRGPVPVLIRPLQSRGFVAVGDMSYSLYLWHYPVIVAISALLPGAGLVALALSVPLAFATRRWVELPFQRPARDGRASRRRPRAPERPLVWGVGAVVVVGALCAGQLLGPAWVRQAPVPTPAEATGVPPFEDPIALRAAVTAATRATSWPDDLFPSLDTIGPSASAAARSQQRECLVAPASALGRTTELSDLCVYGRPTASHTVAVLGDSIAASWLSGLAEAASDADWNVRGIGLESCPPLDVDAPDRTRRAGFIETCRHARDEAISTLIAERPDVVIMSAAAGSLERLEVDRGVDAAAEAWTRGWQSVRARFESAGIRVIVLGSPPEQLPVAVCATRASGPVSCTRPPSSSWERKRAIESGIGGFVDTADWFCSDDECPPAVDGTLVLADGGHLTDAFSRRLSSVLAQVVDAASGDPTTDAEIVPPVP